MAEALGWNQYATITFHFNKPSCGSFPKLPALGLNYYVQTAQVEVRQTPFSEVPCNPTTAALPAHSNPAEYTTPPMADHGITSPQLSYKVDPDYTEEARRAGVQGVVTLALIVQPNGSPSNIVVQKGLGYGLDQKAIEAVRQWRFQPGRKSGQDVPVAAVVEVTFRLL